MTDDGIDRLKRHPSCGTTQVTERSQHTPGDAITSPLVRPASCRSRPSTLVTGPQQAIYFETCTARGFKRNVAGGTG